MRRQVRNNAGFTLVELMIVMAIFLIVIVFMYRFYHEAYQEHGNGVRQEIARLQKARVCMRYLEADLQKHGTALTSKDTSGATIVAMPATGTTAVRYRLAPDGLLLRLADGEKLALLDGLTTFSLQPYSSYAGLYRLKLAFAEHPAVHSTLDSIDRVLGFPLVKGGEL